VIYGPGLQYGFHIPEGMFHLPEFLALEGYLFCREVCICDQNPLAIEAGLILALVLINAHTPPLDLEVLPIFH
jgi:hypothetical protein